MARALDLLRTEPRARLFFGALAQSSIGTGAAYVALVVVAYDRFDSPVGISIVLLADFLPAMLLGPLLGAIVDRFPRRRCAIAADVCRLVAFAGIALLPSRPATVIFSLLAGLGTGLFKPAVLASLPSVVPPDRAATATSLYGVVNDAGYMLGPALAAAGLVVAGPEELLLLNAFTFALSAVALLFVPFRSRKGEGATTPPAGFRSLLREARDGLQVTAGRHKVRVVLAVSGPAMFFGGIINVAELPFAKTAIGTTTTGYAVLVACFGVGFVGGSLSGAGGGSADRLRRRYLSGLFLMGATGLLAGGIPEFALCLVAFGLAGLGNGAVVVHERLMIQSEVPDAFQGRVFALMEGMVGVGVGAACVSAGVLVAALSAQALIVMTGAGELLVAVAALFALSRQRVVSTAPGGNEPHAVRSDQPAEAAANR